MAILCGYNYASNFPPYIMNLLGNAVTHPCLLNPFLDMKNFEKATLEDKLKIPPKATTSS